MRKYPPSGKAQHAAWVNKISLVFISNSQRYRVSKILYNCTQTSSSRNSSIPHSEPIHRIDQHILQAERKGMKGEKKEGPYHAASPTTKTNVKEVDR